MNPSSMDAALMAWLENGRHPGMPRAASYQALPDHDGAEDGHLLDDSSTQLNSQYKILNK